MTQKQMTPEKKNRFYPSLQKKKWGNYYLRGKNERYRHVLRQRNKEQMNHTQEYCDAICLQPILGYENSIVGEQCLVCGRIY